MLQFCSTSHMFAIGITSLEGEVSTAGLRHGSPSWWRDGHRQFNMGHIWGDEMLGTVLDWIQEPGTRNAQGWNVPPPFFFFFWLRKWSFFFLIHVRMYIYIYIFVFIYYIHRLPMFIHVSIYIYICHTTCNLFAHYAYILRECILSDISDQLYQDLLLFLFETYTAISIFWGMWISGKRNWTCTEIQTTLQRWSYFVQHESTSDQWPLNPEVQTLWYKHQRMKPLTMIFFVSFKVHSIGSFHVQLRVCRRRAVNL